MDTVRGFHTLMVDVIPDLHTLACIDAFQCFPFYSYDEDGSNRHENITDWSLNNFRTHYRDETIIANVDIFHYRLRPPPPPCLPRALFRPTSSANCPAFPLRPNSVRSQRRARGWRRSTSATMMQPEYRLRKVETLEKSLDWRVEKMRLSKLRKRSYAITIS